MLISCVEEFGGREDSTLVQVPVQRFTVYDFSGLQFISSPTVGLEAPNG